MKAIQWSILALFFFFSCKSSSLVLGEINNPDQYFYFQPTNNSERTGWVMLLPGSSGLTIFKDEDHYFDVAHELNSIGFDVVLVDYKPAYRSSGRNVKETRGEKIQWVTKEAIIWARNEGYINNDEEGSIIGWSLAGEGLILMANDLNETEQFNIKSIALYYPSNNGKVQLRSTMPVLIQSGEIDNVTKKSDIEEFLSNGDNTELIFYKDAHHAFDVKSLKEGKTIKFPPIIGKKYIFKYNKEAAIQSLEELKKFLLDS